jgi:hypothetical protein
MHSEITYAVAFVVRMLGRSVDDDTRRSFSESLAAALVGHFSQAAWDPAQPMLGSAYRCVRTEAGRIDPLLAQAASKANLPAKELPSSLSLWVDPGDVTARIGADGSLFSVLDGAAAAATSPPLSPSPPASLASSLTSTSPRTASLSSPGAPQLQPSYSVFVPASASAGSPGKLSPTTPVHRGSPSGDRHSPSKHQHQQMYMQQHHQHQQHFHYQQQHQQHQQQQRFQQRQQQQQQQ